MSGCQNLPQRSSIDASMLASPQLILRVIKLQGTPIPPSDLSRRPPEVAVRQAKLLRRDMIPYRTPDIKIALVMVNTASYCTSILWDPPVHAAEPLQKLVVSRIAYLTAVCTNVNYL